MTKQILLSLLNCSWQWMLLSGLIWFVVTPLFHKNRRSNTTLDGRPVRVTPDGAKVVSELIA